MIQLLQQINGIFKRGVGVGAQNCYRLKRVKNHISQIQFVDFAWNLI